MTHLESQRCVTVVAHDIGPFGGMEKQLTALIERLLARGIEVRAIGRRIELEPHENLTTYEVRGPRRPFPVAYPWFFLAGSLAVARYRMGAVYTMGAIVFNRADAAKVPFCHAAWAADGSRPSRAARSGRLHRLSARASALLARLAERVVYRPSRCGRLVAMSRSGAAELDHHFPSMAPAAVIPNGVDIERFAPDPRARREVRERYGITEDQLLAVFLGGDWRRKGLPQVIAAIGERSEWVLLVAGGGDYEETLEQARLHGADQRIVLAGRVDDPERHLAAADALVMPSSYEPFGNAVLEASACALPVVVSPAHGVLDFVEDEASGIFVEPDPAAISWALERLGDAGVRRRFGNRGREIALRYSLDAVADRYVEFLLGPALRRGDAGSAPPPQHAGPLSRPA